MMSCGSSEITWRTIFLIVSLSGAPGAASGEMPVLATTDTGLDRESEVQADKIQSLRRERIVRVLGTVSINTMTRIDDALRRWLQL